MKLPTKSRAVQTRFDLPLVDSCCDNYSLNKTPKTNKLFSSFDSVLSPIFSPLRVFKSPIQRSHKQIPMVWLTSEAIELLKASNQSKIKRNGFKSIKKDYKIKNDSFPYIKEEPRTPEKLCRETEVGAKNSINILQPNEIKSEFTDSINIISTQRPFLQSNESFWDGYYSQNASPEVHQLFKAPNSCKIGSEVDHLPRNHNKELLISSETDTFERKNADVDSTLSVSIEKEIQIKTENPAINERKLEPKTSSYFSRYLSKSCFGLRAQEPPSSGIKMPTVTKLPSEIISNDCPQVNEPTPQKEIQNLCPQTQIPFAYIEIMNDLQNDSTLVPVYEYSSTSKDCLITKNTDCGPLFSTPKRNHPNPTIAVKKKTNETEKVQLPKRTSKSEKERVNFTKNLLKNLVTNNISKTKMDWESGCDEKCKRSNQHVLHLKNFIGFTSSS